MIIRLLILVPLAITGGLIVGVVIHAFIRAWLVNRAYEREAKKHMDNWERSEEQRLYRRKLGMEDNQDIITE